MKKSAFIVVTTLLFLTGAVTVHAQRTSQGTIEVTASVNTSFNSFGGDISAAYYFQSSYIGGGVSYMDRKFHEKNYDENVSLGRAEAYVTWMWRFFGSRGRAVNLYLGGDIFLGIEMLDPFKQCTAVTRQALYNVNFEKNRIIYGLSPRLEGEFFVAPRVAIVLPLRLPIAFNTNRKGERLWIVGYEAGIGARFNF